MRTTLSTLVLAALLGACANGNAERTLERQKICPEAVELYASVDHVPHGYRVVALLDSKDTTGWFDEREMPAVHRKQAAELGANGVILTDLRGRNREGRVPGPIVSSDPSRPGRVVAIYVADDSQRVMRVCTAEPTAPKKSVQSKPRSAAPSVTAASRRQRVRPQPPRPAADSTAFFRNQEIRSALVNLERLRFVSGAQEVRQGLVRLDLDTVGPPAQMAYHLGYLHASYQSALPYGKEAVIELWSHGSKIGEFANGGLMIGPDFTGPR